MSYNGPKEWLSSPRLISLLPGPSSGLLHDTPWSSLARQASFASLSFQVLHSAFSLALSPILTPSASRSIHAWQSLSACPRLLSVCACPPCQKMPFPAPVFSSYYHAPQIPSTYQRSIRDRASVSDWASWMNGSQLLGDSSGGRAYSPLVEERPLSIGL